MREREDVTAQIERDKHAQLVERARLLKKYDTFDHNVHVSRPPHLEPIIQESLRTRMLYAREVNEWQSAHNELVASEGRELAFKARQ